MAKVPSNLTSGTDADGNSTSTTASVAPASNALLLLTVSSRTGITADPNQPTITGNGLTWVAVDTSLFDATSSSRRRTTLFRAMGASPSSGTIAIDFGGQNQTDVVWILDQITGVDTSGTNGSGAIVQAVSNETTGGGVATSMSATLATFGSVENGAYGAFGTSVAPPDCSPSYGYKQIASLGSATNGLSASTQWRGGPTTVCGATSSNTEFGVIAVEIKAAPEEVYATHIHTKELIGGSVSSLATDSISPSANKLVLVTVNSRTGITTNPNEPTLSGNGLTWVAIASVIHDNSSSSRRRVTLFRSMGASPSSGALTADFGGQTQTDVTITVDEITGMDTSGTNGSGAVVQSATNVDVSETASNLAATLSALASANNAVYAAFGTSDGPFFARPELGFDVVDDTADGTTNSINNITLIRSDNGDVTPRCDFSTALALGVIAIEIKASTGVSSVVKDIIGMGIIPFAR